MNRRTSISSTDNGLLIGTRPLIEAIEAGKQIDKVLVQRGLNSSTFKELQPLLKEHNILTQIVPVEKLNRVSRKNHQGVIAFTSPVHFFSLADVISQTYEDGESPFILILDRITDVRNFGAICRTAECCGVHAVVVPSRGSAPVNYDALKTSAGALHHLKICREDNLKNTLKFLRDSGLSIVSCTEKTDNTIYGQNLNLPLALIMGSEEDGISPEYLKLSDIKVKLPLKGKIGSLNVSVATGAILYEVIRQTEFSEK